MMSDETTRLRALLDQTEMPWRAVDVVDSGTVLGRGTAILRPHSRWLVRRVAEIDMGDGEERDTAHAALIVAAVNALPGLLDAAERAERAERERDDLAAVLETRTAEHALAMARVAELEAIIAGRTTPPTDEEIEAHAAAGGVFGMVCAEGYFTGSSIHEIRQQDDLPPGRWWAHDREGRPCAWPTAEVSRG